MTFLRPVQSRLVASFAFLYDHPPTTSIITRHHLHTRSHHFVWLILSTHRSSNRRVHCWPTTQSTCSPVFGNLGSFLPLLVHHSFFSLFSSAPRFNDAIHQTCFFQHTTYFPMLVSFSAFHAPHSRWICSARPHRVITLCRPVDRLVFPSLHTPFVRLIPNHNQLT
jgi:hypothetical protein